MRELNVVLAVTPPLLLLQSANFDLLPVEDFAEVERLFP